MVTSCSSPNLQDQSGTNTPAAVIKTKLQLVDLAGSECVGKVMSLDAVLLAHLSRRLTGELIVYPSSGVRRPSFRRPSTISKIFFSETARPIKAKLHIEHP